MTAVIVRLSERLTLHEQPPEDMAKSRKAIETLRLLAKFRRVSMADLLCEIVYAEARRVLGARR